MGAGRDKVGVVASGIIKGGLPRADTLSPSPDQRARSLMVGCLALVAIRGILSRPPHRPRAPQGQRGLFAMAGRTPVAGRLLRAGRNAALKAGSAASIGAGER
jgi:hypothetical protein